jgi:hypothetical protein
MNPTDVDRSESQRISSSRQEREGSSRGEPGRRGREPDGGAARIDGARLREVGRRLGSEVEEQLRKRPYVVLGAAAGLGFTAGSLLGSRLGQMLLAAGLGYAIKNVLEDEAGMERIRAGLDRLTAEDEID